MSIKPLTSSSSTLRPLLSLAVPVLAEETLNLLVGYTDWWLAGNFLKEPQYLAAMGLMSYVLWLLPSMFATVAIGATALVARFVGAGDRQQANHTANQAFLAGAVFAVVVMLAAVFLARPFVVLMNLQGDAAVHAMTYLRIITPAIPFIMLSQVAAACLRGAGDTVSGFVAKTIVNVINVALSASLVLGTDFGWSGLAIGTAVGHGVGGLILLGLVIRGRSGLRLRIRLLFPEFSLIRRMLRIGLPGGIDIAILLACHLAYFSIISSLGTEAAAAHGLGVRIEAMAYLPGAAFQVAAATMTGQFLGAGDPRRATRSAWTACLVAIAIMSAAGVVFYFGGHWFTAFFTGSSQNETARTATQLLRIVAFSMPSLAILMALTGALHGAGDTRWPLAFTLLGFFGLRIPFACLLAWNEIEVAGFQLPTGVHGAWCAMVADVVARSVLVGARFLQGGWRRVRV